MRRLAVLALVVVACSKPEAPKRVAPPPPPPALTAAQAKETLASSPELGDYQFTNSAVSLLRKKSQLQNPVARETAGSLRAAGWIKYDGDDVVLTPKAQADKRFLVRAGSFDIVPLAKKELGDITNVNGDTAHFTWRWIRNDVGNAIRKPDDAEQHAVAKFIYDGKTWSVLSITPE